MSFIHYIHFSIGVRERLCHPLWELSEVEEELGTVRAFMSYATYLRSETILYHDFVKGIMTCMGRVTVKDDLY